MVVSSANLMMVLELRVATQSCVNREYRRGLSTQPWGAPVLSQGGGCGAAYRRSLGVTEGGVEPKVSELGEQHSHICVPLVQVGEAVCRDREMASAVDLFGSVSKLKWV